MRKRHCAAWVTVWRGSEDLRRTSSGCLAWMAYGRRGQGGKPRDPRRGSWALVEPCHNPVHIDRRGDGHVLHVGLGQAPIPRAP